MSLHLTPEEKDLLQALEMNTLVGIENESEEKKISMTIAHDTLSRKRAISIRLPETDLRQVRLRAIEAGVPYQTLISSVLHQYLRGDLTPSRR